MNGFSKKLANHSYMLAIRQPREAPILHPKSEVPALLVGRERAVPGLEVGNIVGKANLTIAQITPFFVDIGLLSRDTGRQHRSVLFTDAKEGVSRCVNALQVQTFIPNPFGEGTRHLRQRRHRQSHGRL